eukprot:XP_011446568.1 PREDICTED: WD repeat-containing protein 61 [Crassostrea gigas]
MANTGLSQLYSIIFKQENAHEDSIWSCAWQQSDRDRSENIITGGIDDLVKVWKWTGEKLELRHVLEGHQLGVVSVDMNLSGTLAASSSLDSHVRVWDVDTGKCIKSMEAGPVDAWTISFSPDSRFLATGSHSGKINLFGVESGRKEESLDIRGGFTLSIAYSPDGKLIASGAIDGIINIFDTQTGRLIHTLEVLSPMNPVEFEKDDDTNGHIDFISTAATLYCRRKLRH